MTRVCLVGGEDVDLRAELLASETASDALSAYELETPFANCVAVETISLGAAVSLCNDLNWYLRRYADDAIVLEPSVSEAEWLSRSLATAIRNERIAAGETGTFLKIYGVVEPAEAARPNELVEPLLARRIGDETPEYDLRDVADTVTVRVTASEFGA